MGAALRLSWSASSMARRQAGAAAGSASATAAGSAGSTSSDTTGRALPVGVPHNRAAPASVSRPPAPESGTSLITVPLHRIWGPVQFWAALIAGRAICLMREFDPAEALVVTANFTPIPRDAYRVGLPADGTWELVLNSDDRLYGGSGYPVVRSVQAQDQPHHGRTRSGEFTLGPLAISLYRGVAP